MKLTRTWRRANSLLVALGLSLGAGGATASILDAPLPYDDGPIPFTKPPLPSGNPVVCGADQGGAEGLGYQFGASTGGAPGDNSSYNLIGSGGVLLGTVTIDVINSTTINWTSTYPIRAVIIKGATDSNVYPYSEVPNENELKGTYPYLLPYFAGREYPGPQVADSGLITTGGGTSHVEFCFKDNDIIVRPPDIAKTAVPSWIRYHDWTLSKDADPENITMYDGDTHDVDYTVTATKDPWGNFTVAGEITLSDPLDQGFVVNSVADTITFAADPNSTAFHPTLACDYVDDATDVFYRCTYSMTLSSKVHTFLAAGGTGVNVAVAQVSLNGNAILTNPGQATANFQFPANPSASYGDQLDVDDTMVNGTGSTDHVFNDDGTWVYPHTFACPDDDGDNPNTATGTFTTGPGSSGQAVANENVNVDCRTVNVSKTAYTRFKRDFDWTPDKKIVVRPEDLTVEEKSTYCSLLASGPYVDNYLCDDITIKLPSDGVYDTVYALKATKDAGTDSDMQVYGTIHVGWDADAPDPVFSGNPTDVLSFAAGMPATINGVVSNCVTGDNAIDCDYVADVVDLRAGKNTASIDRPHVCYDSSGNVEACAVPGSSTYTGHANFSFGDPTTVVDDCVVLKDLFNDQSGLNIGPSFMWTVIDPLCESATTYVTGEVAPGKNLDIFAAWAPEGFEEADPACTFYVPNVLKLKVDDGMTETDDAQIGVYVTDVCAKGCTLTQGYWKTHAIYAAKPQFAKKRDATWDEIGGLAENTVFFLSGKTWINVFWTAPKGDAYYNLAHQYMAAKLNIYAGASTTPAVDAAIAGAEAWFATHAPGSNLSKSDKAQLTSWAATLASYNEGAVGPGHCSEGPLPKMMMAQ